MAICPFCKQQAFTIEIRSLEIVKATNDPQRNRQVKHVERPMCAMCYQKYQNGQLPVKE